MSDPQTYVTSAIIGVLITIMLGVTWKGWGKVPPEKLAAILTTLGIFGTFLGITVALSNIEPGDIAGSVPGLLGGMRLAFITSVAGIFLAILVRARSAFTPSGAEEGDAASIDALLKTQLDTLRDIRTGLVGEGDTTLLSQLRLMRQESVDHGKEMLDAFAKFSEELANDNTQALIEALEGVMRDFNTKINEQFGDNFKQLNEGVGRMLEWQQEYKEQVETATNALKETAGSLDGIRESMEKIEPQCVSVQQVAEQLSLILKSYEQSHEELEAKLEGFAAMATQAREALPIVETSLRQMTEGIGNAVSASVKQSEDMVGKQSKAVSEMQGTIGTSLKEMAKGLGDSVSASVKQSEDMVEEQSKAVSGMQETIGTSLKEMTKGLGDSVSASVKQSEDMVEKQSKAVSGMQETIGTSLKEMTKALGDAISASVKESADNLRDAVKASVKQSAEALGEAISASIKETEAISASVKKTAEGLEGAVSASVKHSEGIVETLKTTVSGMETEITKTLDRADRDLKVLSERNNRRVEETLAQLDTELERELTNSMTAIGRNLASLSERFAEDYGPITDRLREIIRIAEGTRS